MNFKELLEQELDKLNEALDKPLPWEWRTYLPTEKEAVFRYTREDDSVKTVIVGFELMNFSWTIDFKLEDGSFDEVTSHYKSFQVLSTVVDIVTDFAYKEKPSSVVIESDSLDIDRTSVYLKILKRNLPPEYVIFKERLADFDVIHIVDKELVDVNG